MEQPWHILIIDDIGTPTLNKRTNYIDAIDSKLDGDVKLLVISSFVSDEDRQSCLDFAEIKNPTANGMVEVQAVRMHQQHGIHAIFTRQEDLLLRAANLRNLFGIDNGLSHQHTLLFRDKVEMKTAAKAGGVLVPPYRRVFSPADVISFIADHGYPVVVKPSLGSASSSVSVLKNNEQRDKYFENDFYSRIDDNGRCMDYGGDIIVEKFIDARMCHINGYAKSGRIEIVWPFRYISTNFGFTKGVAYGNVLVPRADPRHQLMVSAAQKVLDALPCSEHMMFHLEMFETFDADQNPTYTLCEIAARRPGGSIGNLIDECEGSTGKFPETEFRLSCGLQIRYDRASTARVAKEDNFSVADLMVPKKIGKLVKMPPADSCPIDGVQYYPIASEGSVYTGFNITVMNTAARFVAITPIGGASTVEIMEEKMRQAFGWFESTVKYDIVE